MRREDALALAELQRRSYDRSRSGFRQAWPRASAMDAESLAAFLAARRYAVLATSRPDGRPQASPVAFTVDGGSFWVASVSGPRVRNVRATPYASLVLMEGEGAAHRAVSAEGPIVLYEGNEFDAVRARLDRLWVERHGSTPDWAAALLELRPTLLFSYDASVDAA